MDYEKMWFNLKAYIIERNFFSQKELMEKMTEEEIKANTDILFIETNKEGNKKQ